MTKLINFDFFSKKMDFYTKKLSFIFESLEHFKKKIQGNYTFSTLDKVFQMIQKIKFGVEGTFTTVIFLKFKLPFKNRR